jgi:Trypsin-like peptidase domain
MFVLEVFQSIFVSILIAYLGFTQSLALRVEGLLTAERDTVPHVEHFEEPPVPQDSTSTELTLLSRIYAASDGVSRVLFENDSFQEAARSVRNAAQVPSVPPLPPRITDALVTDALVNIFCEYRTEDYTRTTTGTGFFINDRGVILTNAHVAQFLLLEAAEGAPRGSECVIRSGNPATPKYHAELLFISPTWILNNAKLIAAQNPRGTGEFDYALLYVASALEGGALPEKYPALAIHTDLLSKKLMGESVMTAGYPAEKLSREGPKATLEPALAYTTIGELYTFGSNYADIFSIAESPVGEQGASGGPVVSPSQGALGLIVTKGDAATEGTKSLRALSLSYIDRTIREETGYSLTENAGGDLTFRGEIFKKALAPFLTRLLTNELDRE